MIIVSANGAPRLSCARNMLLTTSFESLRLELSFWSAGAAAGSRPDIAMRRWGLGATFRAAAPVNRQAGRHTGNQGCNCAQAYTTLLSSQYLAAFGCCSLFAHAYRKHVGGAMPVLPRCTIHDKLPCPLIRTTLQKARCTYWRPTVSAPPPSLSAALSSWPSCDFLPPPSSARDPFP